MPFVFITRSSTCFFSVNEVVKHLTRTRLGLLFHVPQTLTRIEACFAEIATLSTF